MLTLGNREPSPLRTGMENFLIGSIVQDGLTFKGLRPIFCLFLKFEQALLVRVLMLNF